MNMINPLRRFPTTFAALALLVSPLGCFSETHTTPVAETPAMPATSDGGVVTSAMPSPEFVAPHAVDHEAIKIDQEVHRTAGDVKEEAVDVKREAEGEVKKAGEAAEKDAKEIEEEARKAAEKALDNLLPNPK